VLWTLRYGDEVRDSKAYFADIGKVEIDSKSMTLVKKLIDERTQEWDAKMARDPVQERLKEIIASKKAPRSVKAKPEAQRPSNVVDIMDALRKSVAKDKRTGRR
jgi:DNA end-binding protein Ku